MATFPIRLLTPESVLMEEDAEAVFLRTVEGEIAFLAGHIPLVGAVAPGMVRVQHADGSEERAAVHGGFVRVDGDSVTIAAPVAELASQIDVERARRALEAAESDESVARAQARLDAAAAS
ncbi:MAG: ATP synthase F1 subunit epsilon [Acidimicrobiales bacterium]